MSDITLNLDLSRKRLLVHVSEMKLQLERMDLRKLEIQDELRKIEENIKVTSLDITNTQESLNKLVK